MLVEVDGLGFIGDPHITCQCPPMRLDESFLRTALNKLRQSLDYCGEHNLYPLILGDLFHCPSEIDSRLETKVLEDVSRVFHKNRFVPSVIPGNHDMNETILTPDTSLAVLEAAGLVEVLDITSVKRFLVKGKQVAINGVPYGMGLPDTSAGFRQEEDDVFILLTHHDLGFYKYPGVIPLEEIKGVDHVVNGHIHLWQDSQSVGETTYHNPGTILRQKIDEKDYEPSILIFDSQNWSRHVLRYKPAEIIFDMSGKQIKAAEKEQEDVWGCH